MTTDVDLGQVVMLKPSANNPATKPTLTDELVASVKQKAGEVLALLSNAANEFGVNEVTFANSFGAEDMVLTDIIQRQKKLQLRFSHWTLVAFLLKPTT